RARPIRRTAKVAGTAVAADPDGIDAIGGKAGRPPGTRAQDLRIDFAVAGAVLHFQTIVRGHCTFALRRLAFERGLDVIAVDEGVRRERARTGRASAQVAGAGI